MSSPASNPQPAIAALGWAAACAEGQRGRSTCPAVTTNDFEAVAQKHLDDVRAELDRVLMGQDPGDGLEALRECGALAALLPLVEGMVGFGDGEWRHKDLWKHTKQVVSQAPERLAVRWAALLHDVGKPKTRSIADDGQVHFFGHAEVGARMFKKLHRRLPLFRDDRELLERVHFLILHHLRASQYKRTWTDSAVRRFAREMGAYMDDLLCLSRADITTKRPERRKRGLQQIDALGRRVGELAAEDAKPQALPTGLGNALMTAFELEPCRLIGDIKRALEQLVHAGSLPSGGDTEIYVQYVRQHRDEFGL